MIDAASAIVSLLAFGAFLLVFYGPWQSVATDTARQCIFEERDAIFDIAASGRMDFKSDEYKAIRDSLNRLIRFAHELSMWKFVLFLAKMKNDGSLGESSEMKVAIENIADVSVRDEVREHVSKAQSALVGMIGLKSVWFVIPSVLLVLTLWPMGKLRAFARRISEYDGVGERVQLEADRAAA